MKTKFLQLLMICLLALLSLPFMSCNNSLPPEYQYLVDSVAVGKVKEPTLIKTQYGQYYYYDASGQVYFNSVTTK